MTEVVRSGACGMTEVVRSGACGMTGLGQEWSLRNELSELIGSRA